LHHWRKQLSQQRPCPASAGPFSPEPESLYPAEESKEHTLPAGSASYKEVEKQPEPRTPPPVSKAAAVSAAPAVRRLARELGVDIHRVPPTGPAGYITADDVKTFAKASLEGAPSTGTTRVEKMNAVRKATMKHMSHCWATIPHVTQHDVADITKLEELRKRFIICLAAIGIGFLVSYAFKEDL